MPTAECATCGAPFVPSAAKRLYCQRACYVEKLRQQAAEGLIARFWAKVKQSEGCWLWTGAAVKGYGYFHLPRAGGGQQTIYAHRFAWTITHGPIPDHLSALHRCDVPLCVRPDHLFVGTQSDNLADARAKGRLIDGKHLIKVSDAGLADIRANYRPRQNGKQLAAKYGISLVSVLRIVNGTQRVVRPLALERVPCRHLEIRGDVSA